MSYDSLAAYYDRLTENAEYKKRALYFDTILDNNGVKNGILLDLACGTGSLSLEMEKLGYDVIGVDKSEAMLNVAEEKKLASSAKTIFLQQDIRELDLFGTVTSTICSLDSINHLSDLNSVAKAFSGVGLFTEPDGIFIFDVNTLYKHKELLGHNTFVFENEDCFACWQNEVNDDNSVEIYLDFFVPEGDKYLRKSEDFKEYYYSDDELGNALDEAGFEILSIYGDLSFHKPEKDAERKIFVARKV